MADMEPICARLCLLTRMPKQNELLSPLSRATVRRMIRLGALNGLTLRSVAGIKAEHYLRAEALLSRSAYVFERVQRFMEEGYCVLLPEDEEWPANLYALGPHMPQYLFVRGNTSLFSRRCIALAGSRKIDERTEEMAGKCGAEIAMAGYAMVSGGARGVDTAAQKALWDAGGSLMLVPAFPAHQILRRHDLTEAYREDRFLLVCDTWPDEPFSAYKALSRNHTIYALGDAALVVAARNGVGGSWRGAADCLKSGYTPVYALDEAGMDFSGNQALFSLGAHPVDPSAPLAKQLFPSGEDKG